MTKQYITFQRELTKEQCAALLRQDDRPTTLKLRTTVLATLSVAAIVMLGGWWMSMRTDMSLLTTIVAVLAILACGPVAWMIEQLLRAKRRRRYSQLRAAMLAKHSVISDTSEQDMLLAKLYHEATARAVLAKAIKSLGSLQERAIKIKLDGSHG